jgi:hypothetical protein
MAKQKIFVEKEKFDAVIGKLLATKPLPMKSVKTAGKHGLKPSVVHPIK